MRFSKFFAARSVVAAHSLPSEMPSSPRQSSSPRQNSGNLSQLKATNLSPDDRHRRNSDNLITFSQSGGFGPSSEVEKKPPKPESPPKGSPLARVAPEPPPSSALADNEGSIADQSIAESQSQRLRWTPGTSASSQKRRKRSKKTWSQWLWKELIPELGYLAQGLIAVFHIFIIPYQLCLTPRQFITFDRTYFVGYIVDGLSMLVQVRHMYLAARWVGISRALIYNAEFRPPLVRFLLAIPFDAVFWFVAEGLWLIPYIRLLHVIAAAEHGFKLLRQLQRSPTISYNLARLIFLVLTTMVACHYLACLFVFVSRRDTWASWLSGTDIRSHFVKPPWLDLPEEGGSGEDAEAEDDWAEQQSFQVFIRALYWSLMSLTTVGHVDQIKNDGGDWEFLLGIFIMFVAMFVYTFFIGNMTAMMLKSNSAVEQHRLGLAKIEKYLKKRKVPESLRLLCRKNMQNAFERGDGNDEALLEKLPRSLRSAVLAQINSRVLRRAPIFFRCDRALVGAICSVLRRAIFVSGEIIAKEGEVVRELFFLESGRVMQATSADSDEEEEDEDDGMSQADSKVEEERERRGSLGEESKDRRGSFCSASSTGASCSSMPRFLKRSNTTHAVGLPSGRKGIAALLSHETRRRSDSIGDEPAGLPSPESSRESSMHGGNAFQPRSRNSSKADDDGSAHGAAPQGPVGEFSSWKSRRRSLRVVDAVERAEVLAHHHASAPAPAPAAASAADGKRERVALAETPRTDAGGKTANKGGKHANFEPTLAATPAASLGSSNHSSNNCGGLSSKGSPPKPLVPPPGLTRKTSFFQLGAEMSQDGRKIKLEHQLTQSGLVLDTAKATEISVPGTSLCEVAFVFGVRQHATLVARERTICLALTRSDYKTVVAEFHGEARKIQGNVLEQVKARGTTSDASAEELKELIEQRKQGALFELLNAASDGEVESVRSLLQESNYNLQIDEADYDKRTALHVAASEGQVSVVEALLQGGADVNVRDRWGGTPLADAIRQGADKVFELLLKAKGVLGYDEAKMSSVLCDYAKEGRKEAIIMLLMAGGSVNAADYDKRTAIHLAASEGNLQIVDELLNRGALINVKDRWGGTPLRDAVREGHTKLVKRLKERGGILGLDTAEVSAELCEAARQGKRIVVEALLAAGANIDAADYDLRTCLHLAASEGNYPIVEYLCSMNADINVNDRWGGTPLRDALREGHRKVAALLHSKGGTLGEKGLDVTARSLESDLQALLQRS